MIALTMGPESTSETSGKVLPDYTAQHTEPSYCLLFCNRVIAFENSLRNPNQFTLYRQPSLYDFRYKQC